MTSMTDDVVVTNNPGESRYKAHLAGALAGFAAYRLSGGVIVFTHTEVDDAYEGKGVGSALAKGALDDVRAMGERTVVPLCPFIKGWIARHDDYRSLVHVAPDGETQP